MMRRMMRWLAVSYKGLARMFGWFRQRQQMRESAARMDIGGDERFVSAQQQLAVATSDARSAAADRKDAVAALAEANDQVRKTVDQLVHRMEGPQ